MPPHDATRSNVIAYVAPFVVFIVCTMFESKELLGLSYQTLYACKLLLVSFVLWCFRKRYPRFATAGFGLAIAVGTLGCVVWILLEKLQAEIPGINQFMTDVLQAGRVAYDPFSGNRVAATRIAFVVVRLIGLAIVVPLMEEVFWRGFLARYLIADDFQNVPQGVFNRFSFVVVTLAFASVHPEILAAIAWGAMINLLYWKTANLWACVVMHAVTNGLLGAYILMTGNWQLW